MQQHRFGRMPPVSALTLGGGGLGMVWGETTFEECVLTVHAAVEAGITLLDLAPRYGDGKAEEVVGAAFAGRLPAGWAGRYGVIAMAPGRLPTSIARSAVLVAVRIGVTVPETPPLTT